MTETLKEWWARRKHREALETAERTHRELTEMQRRRREAEEDEARQRYSSDDVGSNPFIMPVFDPSPPSALPDPPAFDPGGGDSGGGGASGDY
jgi:hypothetical protein